MLLKNKVAIITGCNRGIGKSILEAFYNHGATIIACIRKNDDKFDNFFNDLKSKNNNKSALHKVILDLSDKSNILEAVKKIKSFELQIDILVNNAGILRHSPYLMTREEDLEEIFKINYFNTSFFTKKIIGTMIKNKNGSIINISSISGVTGNAGRSAYSASKAAIISETKVLSKELGFYNIKVNAIAPGLIDTEMLKHNLTEEEIQKIKDNISLRRIGKTQDVANTALFLGSDLSNYMTGQTLIIDGGM
jgi:3-oxoacyl-[acyl-carrier protein] reductase